MKKVALYFYSQGNLGDDLFVEIINQRYANRLEFISKIAPSLSYMNDVKIFRKGFAWVLLKAVAKLINHNIDMLLLIRRNDLLLYVGGSIFIENNGANNLTKWRRDERFYKSLKKPYFILGANFGPYIHSEFLNISRNIISGAKDMCFRDTYSRDLFSDLDNVRYASDIVFSLDTSRYLKEEERKVVFSIIDASHHFNKTYTNKYEDEILKLTKRFLSLNYKVVYMSFCRFEGDEKVIEKLIKKLGKEGESIYTHYYRGDIEKALTEISSSSTVVSTRFHATILGLIFNKKIIPFIYSAKTSSALKDMTFPGQYYDMRDIDSDSSTIDLSKIKRHDVTSQKILSENQFKILDKELVKRTNV